MDFAQDYSERYDELEEIISSLNRLIDELTTKSDIDFFEDLIRQYEEEKREVEAVLEEEAIEENKRREREYWADQF